MNKQMTNEEYALCRGAKCPFCGSKNLNGDSFEIDAGIATQEVRCITCEQGWNDVYKLMGYEAMP